MTLGIDLGGTNARAAVVDAAGHVLASARLPLSERTPSAVVDVVCAAAHLALQSAQRDVRGCGVGVAGQLRGETGVVAVAPNLGWRDVPFGKLLQERLGYSVRVVNDLSAAAWGEIQVGTARGASEVLTVFVGSGVGSAIVTHGRLVSGAQGFAGELGHVKVVRDGRLCGCGERGCLEAYVGGHALLAQMKEALLGDVPTLLREKVKGDLTKLSAAVLEEAALEGDAVAKDIYERAAGHLGLAVANQVTVLNPAHLVLGGGVLSHCPHLRERVGEAVECFSSHTSREGLKISPAALRDDSGIVGAALLARELR